MNTRFNFLGVLFFVIITMISPSSFAAEDDKFCTIGGDMGRVLKAVPLNGAAGTRTFSFGPVVCRRGASSYQYLVVEGDYTWATNGNLTVTCTNGRSQNTATFTPQVCTGSGTCTMVDAGIFSKAVTTLTNNTFSFRMGVRGYRAWSCVVAHSAAAAGDIITAWAYLQD